MKKTKLRCVLTVFVTIAVCCAIYFYYFPYADTEAGHQKAIQAAFAHSTLSEHPMQVLSSATDGNWMYLSFSVDDASDTHGVMQLERGINGRYRPISAKYNAFPYTEGAEVFSFLERTDTYGAEESPQHKRYVLTAVLPEGSRIQSFELRCSYCVSKERDREYTTSATIPAASLSTLNLFSAEEYEAQFDFHSPPYYVDLDGVRFLDAAGGDITDEYLIPSAVDDTGAASGTMGTDVGDRCYRFLIALILFLGVLSLLRLRKASK